MVSVDSNVICPIFMRSLQVYYSLNRLLFMLYLRYEEDTGEENRKNQGWKWMISIERLHSDSRFSALTTNSHEKSFLFF